MLLYTKMLKEAKTEETLGLVIIIFIIVDISIGRAGLLVPPLALPLTR